MIDLELIGLRVEPPANTPIVLLREVSDQGRILPIFIGGAEAAAIAFALEGVVTPRPLTHDLMRDMLDTLDIHVARVVLTDLVDGTFLAELELSTSTGTLSVSCRPSDGIALALRTGSPIVATEALLDVAGQTPIIGEPDLDDQDPDDVVEQFRDFIEHVDPEDFAS
ncbi:MAG: bifunctional nuclease family protein [Actinobacteria bacterium]|nr:bifunctional nuclease family protein [Actinomycetota bacterium]